MKRIQRRESCAAIQARGALTNSKLASSNADDAMATGVDAGLLSQPRAAAMAAREELSIALAALKETSEEHVWARERSQHSLAVVMCSSAALTSFMEVEDDSLAKADSGGAGEFQGGQDAAIADLDRLDAGIAEPYTSMPALPVSGGDLELLRERYGTLFRKKANLTMTGADFVCKSVPGVDSDWRKDGPDEAAVGLRSC